jgi:hypothetical protein
MIDRRDFTIGAALTVVAPPGRCRRIADSGKPSSQKIYGFTA